MKTIVFIGTHKSGSSYEAFKAAKHIGYYTVLLTNQEISEDKRTEYPDIHLIKCCDINNMDRIKNCILCLQINLDIKAIVSFIEPYCYTASVLAKEFGLKDFSAQAISIMLNKIESRKILEGTRHIPLFYEIKDNQPMPEEAIEKFPLVLKAPSSAGSKDVYKVTSFRQYKEAYRDIRICYPAEPILAEEYLEGPQYLVETVTINHKVNIVAIIKQEITFTGRFIVTGYQMILNHENEFYQSLKETVNVIIKKHGMKDGPCHLEIRYAGNEWKLIEVNPRISGGAINSFIETACGVNLVEETLKFALGLTPDFNYKFKKETFLKYLVVPKEGILIKVTGKNKASDSEGAEHVYIRPKKGSIIIPPVSMAHRYAYVIAAGKSPEEAKENAEHSASQIKFHLKAINCLLFCGLNNRERRLIQIADKNKEYIEKINPFFNNYVLYNS